MTHADAVILILLVAMGDLLLAMGVGVMSRRSR